MAVFCCCCWFSFAASSSSSSDKHFSIFTGGEGFTHDHTLILHGITRNRHIVFLVVVVVVVVGWAGGVLEYEYTSLSSSTANVADARLPSSQRIPNFLYSSSIRRRARTARSLADGIATLFLLLLICLTNE